jgi:VID27 C-terminal WD40-like domain
LDQYNILAYEDVVVADQFKFGEDKKVIVTLPDNVLMTKRSVRKVT